ncbi:tRNA lysidine(34) synthetase TilS [Aromatoleum petrolei]|uniref:tRNA(Ile)-lysidine synthase n=1 Tax=Aromatoleum petrolei TaxID=76116 RepID=A0ABX1MM89_9RHOO|nr:tRNA lysidine(34) synthetase TilS [Aromatoleum petrolei]NMF87465.1 tRNA lysidine(34) synthetase TilS [Aromatoleum petrolei]QTQ35833.1 tRNA(Ile)-lysidine synthase [Aromatoleum petrolei]
MAATRNRTPPEAVAEEAVAGALAAAGVAPGETVCVALSGGVDSTVLLHSLARLRGRGGFTLVAAHVHHGLSAHADAWLEACRAACDALGVVFHPFRVQVRCDDPAGLEAAARVARHAALARVPCDWLAFGHHQDDQAETLMFRLLRGAGVRGAAGMMAVEPGMPGRLRPLLGLRRAHVVAYARAHGLTWVEDESNADERFARNLLRHRVMPVLEDAFPAAVPALARASAQFREADVLLGELAQLDQAACGGAALERKQLLGLSDERVRNLLRWRIRAMGLEAPARARLVEAVRQLRVAPEEPLRLPLGGVACCAYRGRLWLEAEAEIPVPQATVWHGEAELPWGAGKVVFVEAVGEGLSRAALERAQEVLLGPRWAGLALREGAGRPRRSFKNLCQEAGIPSWLRDSLPVLRVDGAAAWVGEIGTAAEFRCAPGEPGVVPTWEH